MRIVSSITIFAFSMGVFVTPAAWTDTPAAFQQATNSAAIAGESLTKVHRWLHEIALPKIDPKTGLYLARGDWNYRDTAADCYPFLTWAAWTTDRDALHGPVLAVLEAEQRLCNTLDRIPSPYDPKRGKIIPISPEEQVFQASEYVKDGLIAIVEVTGKSPWFDRMQAIQDDIWKHAAIETPFGTIPSTNVEVNGEQIQALARMYTMTGNRDYLTWATRLADYYLSDPDFVPNRLRDHGCEIIGGLGLLFGVESVHDQEAFQRHAPRLKTMFDHILTHGTNEDGIMYNEIKKDRFGKRYRDFSDGWGYNYVGFLCYDYATGTETYTPQVRNTLGAMLKPAYDDYPWEGSIDGFADSIEGALYLINREPVPQALQWVNQQTHEHLVHGKELMEHGDLWGTMKLQANAVRTTLIHAHMHTQGVLALPWQKDMQLGAAPLEDGGLAIVVSSPKDWEGVLEFDQPRHKTYMGFSQDWPRMNTLPEWFTVAPDSSYTIRGLEDAKSQTITGEKLIQGYPLTLKAGHNKQLTLRPAK